MLQPPHFAAGPGNEECVKLPAAWLIEKAGFTKGYTLGRAGISSKHTLALVNRSGATAAEIMALADKIRDAVDEEIWNSTSNGARAAGILKSLICRDSRDAGCCNDQQGMRNEHKPRL